MLFGALAAKGECSADAVAMHIGDREVAEHLCELVLELYGKAAEITTAKSGGRFKIVSFESKSAAKYIRNLTENTAIQAKCIYCAGAFLRGVFLASGRVSDPEKQHSMEFSPIGERIELFKSIFAAHDLAFSTVTRSGVTSLYTKKSDTIEDFFGAAGLNDAFFSLVHLRINNQSRNVSTRLSNCEMSNIKKAVEAAAKQLRLLDELEARGLLSSLPETLYETARLRLRYRDMSLSQLAMAATPPISKSGLSHRLTKLTELAEEIIARQDML